MQDLISRQAAIELADSLKDDLPDDERIADAVMAHNEGILEYQTALSLLPSAQPEPSQVARDIATIIENEQDMRVILKNAQPEITHCRECANCYTDKVFNQMWCNGRRVTKEDYCSRAVRKEDT